MSKYIILPIKLKNDSPDRIRIKAIKDMREVTGWGLRATKDFVDNTIVGNCLTYENLVYNDKDSAEKVQQKLIAGGFVVELREVVESTTTGVCIEVLTQQEFEDLLDKIYPHNIQLRACDLSLPKRLEQAAIHAFTYPESLTDDQVRTLRRYLLQLNNKGFFEFD